MRPKGRSKFTWPPGEISLAHHGVQFLDELTLETAVGGVNTRQVAVASEDSERRSVTHLELLRSSKNRLETLAIAGFPAFGAPGNCRF